MVLGGETTFCQWRTGCHLRAQSTLCCHLVARTGTPDSTCVSFKAHLTICTTQCNTPETCTLANEDVFSSSFSSAVFVAFHSFSEFPLSNLLIVLLSFTVVVKKTENEAKSTKMDVFRLLDECVFFSNLQLVKVLGCNYSSCEMDLSLKDTLTQIWDLHVPVEPRTGGACSTKGALEMLGEHQLPIRKENEPADRF